MHNTSKSNKKGKKCDTSRTRPKAIFVVYASSLFCLVSRRRLPTALKQISSIVTKVEMKKISICKSENFWPFSNKKHFCYMRGQIQSKLLLIERTCNLLVNYRTVTWFRLNSSRKWKEITFANGKKFLHLQMDIFCHFDFVIIEEMPSVCRIFFACWTF